MPPIIPLKDRFWNRVAITDSFIDCWPWTSYIHSATGYGQIWDSRQKHNYSGTHVIAYELHYGKVPKGMCVLHHCDCRPCCNPYHLFIGTKGDNYRDSHAKGRHSHGERHGTAKLTETDVRQIIELRGKMRHKNIAAKFGVSIGAIRHIYYEGMWGHLQS